VSWSRSDFDGIQWEIEAFLGSAAYEAIIFNLILFSPSLPIIPTPGTGGESIDLEVVAELWGAGPTLPMLHKCGSRAPAAAAYGESR